MEGIEPPDAWHDVEAKGKELRDMLLARLWTQLPLVPTIDKKGCLHFSVRSYCNE